MSAKTSTKKPKTRHYNRPGQAKILEAIEASMGIKQAVAKRLVMSRQTLDRRIKADPVLLEALLNAREALGDFAEAELIKLIRAGNPKAIMWYLDRQHKGRGYGQHQVIETGDMGFNLTIQPLPEKPE